MSNEPTQLDRIEQKLDILIQALADAAPDEAEEDAPGMTLDGELCGMARDQTQAL